MFILADRDWADSDRDSTNHHRGERGQKRKGGGEGARDSRGQREKKKNEEKRYFCSQEKEKLTPDLEKKRMLIWPLSYSSNLR